MLHNASRHVSLLLLGMAGIGLWQALKLQTWSFGGPGPGLFPQAVAGLCVFLSLVEFIRPPRPGESPASELDALASTDEPGNAEKRTFWVYVASIMLMTVGAYYAGFAVTTFVLVVLVLSLGEGITWPKAVGAGVLYVLCGWVAFSWLLRVNLPEGPLDRAFLALVH